MPSDVMILPGLTLWPSLQGRGQPGACGLCFQAVWGRWGRSVGFLLSALPLPSSFPQITVLGPTEELYVLAVLGALHSWSLFLILILLMQPREAEKLKFSAPLAREHQGQVCPVSMTPAPSAWPRLPFLPLNQPLCYPDGEW